MPVTVKLSRKFYETFGDEIANELVEWFNQVDATYRGELRELNELNFARFDAKLEQRVAERLELPGRLAAELERHPLDPRLRGGVVERGHPAPLDDRVDAAAAAVRPEPVEERLGRDGVSQPHPGERRDLGEGAGHDHL